MKQWLTRSCWSACIEFPYTKYANMLADAPDLDQQYHCLSAQVPITRPHGRNTVSSSQYPHASQPEIQFESAARYIILRYPHLQVHLLSRICARTGIRRVSCCAGFSRSSGQKIDCKLVLSRYIRLPKDPVSCPLSYAERLLSRTVRCCHIHIFHCDSKHVVANALK